jgi:hypothetical protein
VKHRFEGYVIPAVAWRQAGSQALSSARIGRIPCLSGIERMWKTRACFRTRDCQKIYRLPRPFVDENGMMRYRASKLDCDGCLLKPRCCPNAPARSIHKGARDWRARSGTEAYASSRAQTKEDQDTVLRI